MVAIRHNCSTSGQCYIKAFWPRMEIFAECFPGAIDFGNLDYVTQGIKDWHEGLKLFAVEGFGHQLEVEWKSAAGPISQGQWLRGRNVSWTPQGLTPRMHFVYIAGDPETMEVWEMAKFYNGIWRDWRPTTTDEVKETFRTWWKWISQNPLLNPKPEQYPWPKKRLTK